MEENKRPNFTTAQLQVLKKLVENPESAELYQEFKSLVYELFGQPENHLQQGELKNCELVICENEEKYVVAIIENSKLRLEGEEYGDVKSGSDSYEYVVEFDEKSTSALILEMRRDFGQDKALKDILKEDICSEGRYYGLLRYCEGKGISYNMSTF